MKEIDEQALWEFDRLYYKVMGLYVRFENAHDINKPLYKVLHALYISSLQTQKDIMQNYEMPKQTINNVAMKLQKQGLVEVFAGQNDKREKELRLTQAGAEYSEKFLKPYMDFEKKVAQKLGKKGFSRLLEGFKAFEKALVESLNDEIQGLKGAK